MCVSQDVVEFCLTDRWKTPLCLWHPDNVSFGDFDGRKDES